MKKTFKNMQNSEPRVCNIEENIHESIKCHWYTYMLNYRLHTIELKCNCISAYFFFFFFAIVMRIINS